MAIPVQAGNELINALEEVERLRALIAHNPEGRFDTSGEVQRLRAENERLNRELGECQVGWATGTKAIAENERLRAEYPYSEVDLEMAVEAEVKDLRAEIERLRAELAVYKEIIHALGGG